MFKSRRSIRDEEHLEEARKESRVLAPVSEEKNKFALSVLRRVRVKLEGREPDSLRKVNHDLLLDQMSNFIFVVECGRASGFPNKRGYEHREPGSDV